MSDRPPEELRDALRAVSADMHQALQELTLALETELHAISALDSAALDNAGARKQVLLKRLEELDVERRQLLRAAPDAHAIRDPAWPQIEQTLRSCRELNQRNGKLVNRHLGQVREALSILTGSDGEGRLYDHAGSVHPKPRSHVLAQA
jgi:flagella synthesis protein FlgN